ncbi:LysR family transcriptional regulator [Granulosicoccus antarcticus]|nr:LysR family transcriptional regulator [Granulosicoccus antarcticus]
MEIDPKHLATLHVIFERGGLTAAAAILGTSQPALSRLVGDLEIRLGAPIFDRSTRPWRMTALGEMLAAQGSAVQVAISRATHAIEQFKGGTDGLLKIGCTPYVSDAVVTPMIARFQHTAPDVRIELSHAYTAQLLRRLKRREVDLVIAPVDTMDIAQGLTSQRLIAAKNLIACRKEHPLTRRRKLQPMALLDYRWIAPPADSPLAADMRNVMNRLDAHDIQVAFSGGSLSSVMHILEQSDYLVLLPEHVLNQLADRYDITTLALNLSTPTRSVTMLTNEDDARSYLLEKFIGFLEVEFSALALDE